MTDGSADLSHSPQTYPFEFTGSAREYFGIWMVNLVLTILTLGIYSAWAKVRTKRYFYNNTRVADSSFDYTADPKKILSGRAIAVVMLVIYQLSIQFYASIAIYVFVALVLLVPAIFMSSIAFRMRYSQWRGISFRFERDLAAAYFLFAPVVLYLVLVTAAPLLFGIGLDEVAVPEEADSPDAFQQYLVFSGIVALSAMALFPGWQCWYYNFVAKRCGIGRASFSLDLSLWQLYKMYFTALIIVVLGIAVAVFVAGFMGAMLGGENSSFLVVITLMYLAVLLVYVTGYSFIQTRLTNALYSGISLQGIHFASKLKYGPMLYFYLTNTLAILFSLGLAIPWAKVRVARYRAESMSMTAADLDSVLAQPEEEVNAGADAMSDLFDLDIGL